MSVFLCRIWGRGYGGKSEVEKRKIYAREALKKLHYRHEHTFPFEKYTTVLQSNFKVLERLYVPLYEEDNLIYLLNKISVNNTELKTTISIARQRFNKFNDASTYLAIEVCRIPTK